VIDRRRLLQAAGTTAAMAGAGLAAPAAEAAPEAVPKNFLWGTATSSYQVEGRGDRRADSIWDTFARLKGTIHDGSNGDIADDHYHRYAEDIGLIARAGLKAYRYSISWPRVLPDGTGAPDGKGLDFYSRLTDAVLNAGLEPWVCLYHWDLPQALQDRGGWTARAIADWFGEYALLMCRRLGDRVIRWVMLNEPSVVAIMGYGYGEHAPGFRDRDKMFASIHHLNLAQARALTCFRVQSRRQYLLGTVLSLQPVRPASPSAADRAAAARWDALWNRAFLDPVFRGSYPPALHSDIAKWVQPGDLEEIEQPLDFLGVNYYSPMYQRDDPAGLVGTNWGALPQGTPTTEMGWPVDPAALVEVLTDLRDHYGNPPVYITENGACYVDRPDAQGAIDDSPRIAYLRDHISACRKAIAQGVDLRGYFAWTILDNFEWAYGYTRPFGLVAVDRKTLRRTPKASYFWFSGMAQRNAL
jgi:beta-glucosidase